jgi:hypothetical protein
MPVIRSAFITLLSTCWLVRAADTSTAKPAKPEAVAGGIADVAFTVANAAIKWADYELTNSDAPPGVLALRTETPTDGKLLVQGPPSIPTDHLFVKPITKTPLAVQLVSNACPSPVPVGARETLSRSVGIDVVAFCLSTGTLSIER